MRENVRFCSVVLGEGKQWSVWGICRRMRDVAVDCTSIPVVQLQ
jgi:hypothetical protein